MNTIRALIVIFILVKDLSAQEDLETVEAVVGHSAELPCNISTQHEGDKLDIIAWYKDGSPTAFHSRDFRGEIPTGASGRYHLVRSDELVTLQVSAVTPTDAGLYMCHVDFAASPSIKTYVRVVVIDPPQRLWVIHENGTRLATAVEGSNTSRHIGPFYIGETVHLFCVSFGGKPQPSLSWWIEKRLLKKSSTPLSEQRVRSDVTYGPLEREDHGLILTCQASNNERTKPLTIDVTINMLLSPELVSVRGAGRARVSEPRWLQCRVLGARPPPPIEWRIDDTQVMDLQQNITNEASQRLLVSDIQLTFGPENDESRVTCCARMYERSDEPKYLCAQPLSLTVLYSPIVQIIVEHNLINNTMAAVKGSDVVINCSYQANPNVEKLLWFHEDDILTKHKFEEVTPTLVLANISEEQAGEYACEATNQEGTTYSEPVHIQVTYPAICQDEDVIEYGVGEDEYLNITCNVKSSPEPSAFRWVLVNDSVDLHSIQNASQQTLETEESTLLYQRPAGVSFSTVFCWGLNGVSNSGLPHTACVWRVGPPVAPRAPAACAAVRAAAGLRVSCRHPRGGGLPQKFKFAVVSTGENEETLVTISNVEPTFIIQEPTEENYKFVITAENEKGESSKVIIEKEDIIDETEPDDSPKSLVTNITSLSLALCGGVALVALAACGLVLCAHDRPAAHAHPPLCAYNTEESNCETYQGSDDGSDLRRTDSFRRAVSRYPSKNFDVRRTSSFHSARYMNEPDEQDGGSKYDTFRHSTNCRVHSLQNISRKREMDVLCDNLVMHLPPEVNYNVSKPMNSFYTMPRKVRHKMTKENDEMSEITQSDGFSLPPPPDEFTSYRAGPRIRDLPTKSSPTYSIVTKKNTTKDLNKNTPQYNELILSPINTVGIPTISGVHNTIYSYPEDTTRKEQKSSGYLSTFQSHSNGKESGL